MRVVETTVGSSFRGKEKQELEHMAILSTTLYPQRHRYIGPDKWQHARTRDLKLRFRKFNAEEGARIVKTDMRI